MMLWLSLCAFISCPKIGVSSAHILNHSAPPYQGPGSAPPVWERIAGPLYSDTGRKPVQLQGGRRRMMKVDAEVDAKGLQEERAELEQS